MRRSVLVLAALALCLTRASADLGAANGVQTTDLKGSSKKAEKRQLANVAGVPVPPQPEADAAPSDPAATRELHYNPAAIFPGTTPVPVAKYVGPIIGGVVGAGALAGVIAISVMHKPSPLPHDETPSGSAQAASTTLSTAALAGSTELHIQSTVGFAVGGKVIIGAGTAKEEVHSIVGFGSLLLDSPLKFDHAPGTTVKGGDGFSASQGGGDESPPAPQAFETTLTASVAAGGSLLQAADTSGIGGGDTIKIGSEYNLVRSVSGTSITTDHPMNNAQDTGATVKVVHQAHPPPAAPPPPPAAAAAPVLSARTAGTPADEAAGEEPTTTVAPAASSGSSTPTVVAIIGALLCCGCLVMGLVAVAFFFMGKKKKRSRPSTRETPDLVAYSNGSTYIPEEQAPLNGGPGTMVDMQQTQDLCESQYIPVQQPSSVYVSPLVPTGNLGSVPTMQNVVPMQTMPPPPPITTAAASYQPQASYAVGSGTGSLFAGGQPSYAVGTGSVFAGGQPSYGFAGGQASYAGLNTGGSAYQNASPLANTVNALPSTQFSQLPTIY